MNRIATDPHWLRTLLLAGANDPRPDAELLDRFARYREQAAFEAILRRHGPLVWGVCRRTLSNPADTDDAFQATFLVLVQKAGRIRHGERLGPWLYGVAVKVSRRLRDKARRAPSCDPDLAALMPERERADPDADWLAHLDRELHGLPAKFRDPMVLCELQGLTRTAAAERLRLREGTLSSRLARGRILLRHRLLKYGTLLPAGGLATLLGTASTAPARLLGKTAESVAQVTAAGGILTGVVPASVARLTLEVTGMGLFKLKIAGVMAVTLATLTVGLVAADGPKVAVPKSAEVAKAAAVVEKPAVIEGDLAAMQGLWEIEPDPEEAKRVARMHQAVNQVQLANTSGLPNQMVVGGPGDGVLAPAGPVNEAQLLIRGSTVWEFETQGRRVARYELQLTPGRNPKWIDLVADESSRHANDRPGVSVRGVYRLTATGWEFATAAGNTSLRPAEFVSDNDAKTVRIRRAKPPAAPDAKLADARKELLGRWTVTRQTYPHDNRTGMVDRTVGEVEITPEFLFVQRPADEKKFVWEAAAYTLDPTKEPKWIDLAFTGKEGGDGFGVYELTGDTLRISYRLSVPRVFRTLEFKAGLEEAIDGPDGKTASPKPACALLELKRVKTP